MFSKPFYSLILVPSGIHFTLEYFENLALTSPNPLPSSHTLNHLYARKSSHLINTSFFSLGFPGGSEVKASACNVGDLGSIPWLGRSPGEGNGNPLQYSCLVGYSPRGHKQSDTTEWFHFHFLLVKLHSICDPSSPPGIKLVFPAVKVCSLNHWTTREVLNIFFDIIHIMSYILA